MTLRSSSWVDLIENNKRRVWQWCVSIFLLILFSCVVFLVILMSFDETRYIADYGSLAEKMMLQDARNYAIAFMGASGFKIMLTTVIAVITAFGGYSYLNDRVKLDFYESVPQKRGSRFSTIWISGILIYAGPYIFGTLISMAILNAAGFGGVYGMDEALLSFCYMLVYFLGVYHLFIFSMMLTGTAFACVCAFIVLSVYEPVIRGLLGWLRSMFFVYEYSLSGYMIPKLSPYGLIYYILNDGTYRDNGVKYLIALIILDAVLLCVSYILYLKRPGEAAGKTLAFKPTSDTIKLMIVIPVTAMTAAIVAEVLNRSGDLRVADMLLIVLVCFIASSVACAIMQAVFELDLRAALYRKSHWFICTVCALLLFFGFKQDWLRIDRYVPSEESVESVVFAPEGYEDLYGYIDQDLNNVSNEEFYLRNMFISDVADVCELHRMSIRRYDELIKTVGKDAYIYDPDSQFSPATVFYRMKSGSLVTRRIYIPVKDAAASELLDKIMSAREFVKGYYGIYNYDVEKAIDSTAPYELNATYSNGVDSFRLSPDEVKDIIRLYRTDMENYSYSRRLDELSSGYVEFCVGGGAGGRNMGAGAYRYYKTEGIALYPDMKGCMQYLENKGYYPAAVSIDDISSVEVINYHQDEQDEYAKEMGMPYLSEEEAEQFIVRKRYSPASNEDELETVLSAIYPIGHGSYRWDGGRSFDDEYEVQVYLLNRNDESYVMDGDYSFFGFIRNEVPESVRKDMELVGR